GRVVHPSEESRRHLGGNSRGRDCAALCRGGAGWSCVGRSCGCSDGMAALFKRVDANGDGKISRAEQDAFVKLLPRVRDNPDEAKQRFERLDADKDGMITAEEFKRLNTGR